MYGSFLGSTSISRKLSLVQPLVLSESLLVLPLFPREPKTCQPISIFVRYRLRDFTRNFFATTTTRCATPWRSAWSFSTPATCIDAQRDTTRCHGTTTPNTPTNNGASRTPTPHLHAAHPRRRRGARVPNKSDDTPRQRRPRTVSLRSGFSLRVSRKVCEKGFIRVSMSDSNEGSGEGIDHSFK